MLKTGIDVGSTTLKIAVMKGDELIYSDYQRHYSEIPRVGEEMLKRLISTIGDEEMEITLSGSAGMGISQSLDIPFQQEVFATRISANKFLKNADAIIELGGEDAKIIFLTGGLEARMNGTCAGGTGAFIDQMATLLNIERGEINALSEKATEIYTIASRCGVFAKSDIQPLINQGAKLEDISASILVAVVNQTIAGLAQGRKIKGNVVYLGGPLTFIPLLRHYFDEALSTKGIFPENSLYYVAMGAALSKGGKRLKPSDLIEKLRSYSSEGSFTKLEGLFKDDEEYRLFKERHERATVKTRDIKTYKGKAYLGIDAGSTTIKAALISEDGELLLSKYGRNNGNPVREIELFLKDLYENYKDIEIGSSASTGYGEELLKSAFNLDYSLVETQSHFIGAKFFLPDVDFIIDIGGQDIKCFKIRDGAIDEIFLNEACSSGCGSFLQTFANALGKTSEEFASLALKAKSPVDLGSRCTVFMNSSVKQAQKDGASIEDISAGLAISVVKNALYKVIRTSNTDELGKNIVTQGGTFLNDAVLRAFEKELKRDVIRPTISGLMGAYGAALYAKSRSERDKRSRSSTLSLEEIKTLEHKVQSVRCNGCTNHCLLTINTFSKERRLISGNKCDRPITGKKREKSEDYDIYAYKQSLLREYMESPKDKKNKIRIGLPMALSMYELMPFYYTLFDDLGYEVVVSPFSNRDLYTKGQDSIPSDTVCFPAKLMHGHVEYLRKENCDYIFYPSSSYNIDEEKGTNHYNCPVVAYYGEVIKANQNTGDSKFIAPYMSLENKKHLHKRIRDEFNVSDKDAKRAVDKAYKALDEYKNKIAQKAQEIRDRSIREKRRIIVLAGRPYHVDPEVNHSINSLILELGASVLSEDSLSYLIKKEKVNVLNQWTYHARMYDAARYIRDRSDMELVQLVSFGCGLDAVTTDEVREILRENDKIYTQLKIDEITNTGAVRIRLRSLFAALEDKNEEVH